MSTEHIDADPPTYRSYYPIEQGARNALIDIVLDFRLERGELHVVDQGLGLTPDQRERAFDRFWRASTEPGSGLGLSIAKRLIELDGGTIELRAAATGGIDAVVRYPSRRG